MSSNASKDETRPIAAVIVTHGHLAGELLAAAEMIVGPISFITAVSIGWHDDVDAARDEVQRAITRVSQGADKKADVACDVDCGLRRQWQSGPIFQRSDEA